MSWFVLKKPKILVYVTGKEYREFVEQYGKLNNWSVSDEFDLLFYTPGNKNKKKKEITKYILKSMNEEWEQSSEDFKENHSFVFHANSLDKYLYEMIWTFCQINPDYQMMKTRDGQAHVPYYVDIDLKSTFGNEFLVGQVPNKKTKGFTESPYHIQASTVKLVYGDLMDFRIGFDNGTEYRFQTRFDGRKASGSISIEIGDLDKWNVLLQKAEAIRLEEEKANAPERIVTTEEFQERAMEYSREGIEDFYNEVQSIEKEYEQRTASYERFSDYLDFEVKWLNLYVKGNEKYDEIAAFDTLWNKQPNRDFKATHLYGVMLNATRSLFTMIYSYGREMGQFMRHLYERDNGGKYKKKDYEKELLETQRRKKLIESSYEAVYKRYHNLQNEKQTNSPA